MDDVVTDYISNFEKRFEKVYPAISSALEYMQVGELPDYEWVDTWDKPFDDESIVWHKEICTPVVFSKYEAEQDLFNAIDQYAAMIRGTILFWRVKPEIHYDWATKQYRGYCRLSIV